MREEHEQKREGNRLPCPSRSDPLFLLSDDRTLLHAKECSLLAVVKQ